MSFFRLLKIVERLPIEPELWAGTQETGKADRGIGSDAATAVKNIVYAGMADANLSRQFALRNMQGGKEFFL